MIRAHSVRLGLVLLGAATLLVAGACGGDDDDDSSDETPTGTAITQPSTPQGLSLAEDLAKDPGYFIYIAGKDETFASVADAFDAVPGPAPQQFVTSIREQNKLTGDAVPEGQALAIPLMLPGDLSLFPDSSIEEALGIGGAAGKLRLLQPSLNMRGAYNNKVVLHRVRLYDSKPATEGYGYVLEFYLADRPVNKGGMKDPDARVAEPLFTVAAGQQAVRTLTATQGAEIHSFQRDAIPYAVKVYPSAERTAADLAGMLQTASER